MDATYTAGFIVTMEPTTLYGYIPTHWLAILFVVSCMFTLLTGIPALFFKYPNHGLGHLIVLGTLCQLVGHVCMAVSSFQPTNLAAWGVQLFAFMFGKTFARVAVFSTYHACFRRVAPAGECHNSKNVVTDDWFLGGLASITGLCFGYRLFYDLWQFSNVWTYYGGTAQSPSYAYGVVHLVGFVRLCTPGDYPLSYLSVGACHYPHTTTDPLVSTHLDERILYSTHRYSSVPCYPRRV